MKQQTVYVNEITGHTFTSEEACRVSEALSRAHQEAQEMRRAERATKQGLTLGQLIDKFAAIQDYALPVRFAFCGLVPGSFHSYRGYYEDLALGYLHDGSPDVSVDRFRERLDEAVGKTFVGYKGGDYTMDRQSRVWVSSYGSASGCGITDVLVEDYLVLLEVGKVE